MHPAWQQDVARLCPYRYDSGERSQPFSGLRLPSDVGRQLRSRANLSKYQQGWAKHPQGMEAIRARWQRDSPLPPVPAPQKQDHPASLTENEDWNYAGEPISR
jgi:hypothetical protein